MSSIAPLVSREVAEALAEKGVAMLDAPVSGGEPKAIDGTLSIMVGGDRAVFDQVQRVLAAMGSHRRPRRRHRRRQHRQARQPGRRRAEHRGRRRGAGPRREGRRAAAAVFEAIRGGLAGSTVLEAKAPMMLDRNFKPGFRINLHMKDLLNALDTSHEVGVPLPLTAAVLEMLTALKADGHEREDHSGLRAALRDARADPTRTDRPS